MLPQSTKASRRLLTRHDVLSAREVAELLHVPASTVFDYARRGLLPWSQARTALDLHTRRARYRSPRDANLGPAARVRAAGADARPQAPPITDVKVIVGLAASAEPPA
jgi:hypothetical protein